MTTTRTPANAFGLKRVATVCIDDEMWVIYDDEIYRWAIPAEDWLRETGETDYTTWCVDETCAADDQDLCARIVRESGIDYLYIAGSCIRVEADDDDDDGLCD